MRFSAQGATLFPYYALGVVAVFVHLARPLRLFALRRVGASRALIVAAMLMATGVVVGVLLLTALANPGAR